jgi:hypothetical protein
MGACQPAAFRFKLALPIKGPGKPAQQITRERKVVRRNPVPRKTQHLSIAESGRLRQMNSPPPPVLAEWQLRRLEHSPGLAARQTANEPQIPAPERTKTWDLEDKLAISSALFARFALLAAARLACGLPWLVTAMVPFVVRHGLGDLLRGKLAGASQVQYIIGD